MNNCSSILIRFSTFFIASVFAVGFYNFLYFEFIEISDLNVNEVEIEKFIETSVCEIGDYPNNFENRQVKTKATLYTYEEKVILFPILYGENGCEYRTLNSFDSIATVEFQHYFGKNYNLKEILLDKKPFAKEIDVEIEGRIKLLPDEDGYKIIKLIPQNIKTISVIKKFSPKGAA